MLNSPFCILHISDLHRNEDGRVENGPLYASLVVDAELYMSRQFENLPKPAIIIVSGDLVYGSPQDDIQESAIETRKQYEEANDFLTRITNEFLEGDKKRIIIIPGNHDVNWSISKASMKLIDISKIDVREKRELINKALNPKSSIRWSWQEFSFYKIADEDLYNTRLKYFAEFYSKFYEGKRAYPLEPESQFDVFDIPELNTTVVGFNSCFRNDHLNKSGLINTTCLSNVTLQLREHKKRGRLLLASWHHNISGAPMDSTYLDPRQIKSLISIDFSIGFHGHQHLSDIVENRLQFDTSRKLVAISAGTLCSARSHLPTGYKRQYNLIRLDIASNSCYLYSREVTGNMELQITFPQQPLASVSEENVNRLKVALGNKDYETFLAIIHTISIDDLLVRSLVVEFNKETKDKYITEICSVLVNPINSEEYLIFLKYYELGRTGKTSAIEIFPLENDFGFFKLPEPSTNDIFFDIEGDPYVRVSGVEYLFGWLHKNVYYELWASNDVEEKKALENFIDTVIEIRNRDAHMHVYHFGTYEQAALKRLVGKYAIKEDELDFLLRANVFINLHTITRRSRRGGFESYSLKDFEKLHGYLRLADLRTVAAQKLFYERLLESGNVDAADEQTINIVRNHNRDECISAEHLRNWLEAKRTELIKLGNHVPRPEVREVGETVERVTEHQKRIKPLYDALISGVPFEKENRTAEQQAKWLLANMLDWYRREKKSFWWEYYRLSELSDDELIEEDDALADLVYTGKYEQVKKSVIHFYTFPEQEFTLKEENNVSYNSERIGEVYSIDLVNRIVGIKKRKDAVDIHPTNIISCDEIKDTMKEEAIIRFAEYVAHDGLTGRGTYKAGRELLLRAIQLPIEPLQISEETNPAIQQVMHMNESVLLIQGPPGTGKSHIAALMIISLIKAGKKIGISALSHKVITGLLEKLNEAALRERLDIQIVQKIGELRSENFNWTETADNAEVFDCIQNGFNIAAGTPFMWSRPEFFRSVDFLFVDEAGQLSLIDTLALSHAGKNLVLMGDPQQLKQPQKGIHPEGTEVSALEHILQKQKTISEDQGIFLNPTLRMHPAINNYISEMFYDGRLHSIHKNEKQRLEGNTKFKTPGIYFEPVIHFGNRNISVEEVERIKQIIDELLSSENYCIESDGDKQKLSRENIMIISPYNAQVNTLRRALPQIQIGTVDKFQGREAEIVILTMASSSAEDAPRGMEFLYSLNRLNVAVSRAKIVFILVASPTLLEAVSRSPHQMQLISAFRRLKEIADQSKKHP